MTKNILLPDAGVKILTFPWKKYYIWCFLALGSLDCTKNMNLKLLNDENNTSTNIYVSTDRTQKQRDADKELRKELTRQKLKNPNLTIRNNRIVPFRRPAQDNPTWASVWE